MLCMVFTLFLILFTSSTTYAQSVSVEVCPQKTTVSYSALYPIISNNLSSSNKNKLLNIDFGSNSLRRVSSLSKNIVFKKASLSLSLNNVSAFNFSRSGNLTKAMVNYSRPSEVYESSHPVVIDAGHGAGDTGAIYKNLKESVLVSGYAKTLGNIFKYKYPGIVIKYSRPYKVKSQMDSLRKRVRYSNKSKASVFVSIHVNSNERRSINGSEIYYNNHSSKKLALSLAANIKNETGTNVRVKKSKFYVIKNQSRPSVLIEVAYLSNQYDRKRLLNKSYMYRYLSAVALVLSQYSSPQASTLSCKSVKLI